MSFRFHGPAAAYSFPYNATFIQTLETNLNTQHLSYNLWRNNYPITMILCTVRPHVAGLRETCCMSDWCKYLTGIDYI